MGKGTVKGAVDPSLYPTEVLQRDHLALLRCVNDTPAVWSNGPGPRPEIGKHYIAFSSSNSNWFGPAADDRFSAMLMNEHGRPVNTVPLEDFEVVDDPHHVMERKRGFYWYLWNTMHWRRAKMEQRDRSLDAYSEDYLIKNHLALVKYPETSDAHTNLVPGKQYLATSHLPDLSSAVYISYIVDNPDGTQSREIRWFSDFDILSDPLGLLDPWKTEWKDNEEIQKKLRPDLYPEEKDARKSRRKQ